MGKRGMFFGVVVFLIIVLAISHTAVHFYVWGTGIPGFAETGISGLSVGEFSIGEEATGTYSLNVSLSQMFVVGEWILVFFVLLFSYTRGKIDFRREIKDLELGKAGKKGVNKTDLDRLYELLQDKKRIRFLAIQKVFDVDREVVADWAETLEAGNLATIDYPRVGEPQLVLVEKKELKEE